MGLNEKLIHLKKLEKARKHLSTLKRGTPHYRDTEKYVMRLQKELKDYNKFKGAK